MGGAFRRFETDYWALSYREATEYLNKHAPPDASIVVWGPDHVVKRYARGDLQILELKDDRGEQGPSADYAILSTRWNTDRRLFPEAEIIYQVGRQGAVFAVVKQIPTLPDQTP